MEKQSFTGNSLHWVAQFSLFATSYIPLFILIIVKQVSENYLYLNIGKFSLNDIYTFSQKFGLSVGLSILTFCGLFGFKKTIKNIEKDAKNGFPILIKNVHNKNNEAIGYIATYIIPFLFQNFNNWYESFSIFFLLIIIFRIYINSSLLLINPLLSLKYSIYEIDFEEKGKKRNGLVISRNKRLEEETEEKLYEIGHKLYFSINLNKKNQ